MHLNRLRLGAIVALLLPLVPVRGEGLDWLTDPRPQHHWLDATGRVPASAGTTIDQVDRDCRAADAGEILVVTVSTTAGRNLREAGTALFNRWRIGSQFRNDGVLVVLALDDRRGEIILGSGIDDAAAVSASQGIFDQEMRPRLRAGDIGGALIAAVRACDAQILRPRRVSGPAIDSTMVQQTSVESGTTPIPAVMPSTTPAVPYQPQAIRYTQTTSNGNGSSGGTYGIGLWLAGGGILVFGGVALTAWNRRRPKRCSCGGTMVQLGEVEDDQHLSAGERTEEQLGSVDYDVWSCPSCGTNRKLRYGAWFSGYANCRRCGNRTRSSQSTTLRAASESEGGLVQVVERCRHCQDQSTHLRRTPRITTSGSSGCSSSFGGSSGGGRSSGGGSAGRGGGGGW